MEVKGDSVAGRYKLLALLTGIYVISELGHALINVVSRAVAQDIGYGDKSCQAKAQEYSIKCLEFSNELTCTAARSSDDSNGTTTTSPEEICEWTQSGLGSDFQILAGPAFIVCFTLAGIFWGFIGDKFNRVYMLGVAALVFSLVISGTSLATQYWHLVVLRILLGFFLAACAPLATSLLADAFPQEKRAVAMGIFNWGIYFGLGLSFAVGTYVTDTTIFNEPWRTSFFVSGIPGVFISILFLVLVKEPRLLKEILPFYQNSVADLELKESSKRPSISETKQEADSKPAPASSKGKDLLGLIKRPEIIILVIAACIRHAAGFCWAYNSTLYYQTYYPDYENAGWALMGAFIAAGVVGVFLGGLASDNLVSSLGISARVLVLGVSQMISVPFTIGMLYVGPPWSFPLLFVGYVMSEMWFAPMYAVLLELVPESCQSTAVGLALFLINNVGGNLPIVVEDLRSVTDYRTAIAILCPGLLFTSSILFFICWAILRKK